MFGFDKKDIEECEEIREEENEENTDKKITRLKNIRSRSILKNQKKN